MLTISRKLKTLNNSSKYTKKLKKLASKRIKSNLKSSC